MAMEADLVQTLGNTVKLLFFIFKLLLCKMNINKETKLKDWERNFKNLGKNFKIGNKASKL